MAISELYRRMISYSEFRWFLQGSMPTPEQLKNEFNLSGKQVKAFLDDEAVQKSFTERGIPTIQGRTLTPEQITAVNTMLNFADGRSERKKLADMVISATKWNGWKQQPEFKEYFLARTESILGDSIGDVNVALVDRARNGDLGAIKMVYEITGRYRGAEQVADPRQLMNQILEVISIHVQDPEVLRAISLDFARLAGVAVPDTVLDEPPVAGVVVSQITGGF